MEHEQEKSFGVFKPVGHVVISLPNAGSAETAARALGALGVSASSVRRYTDREMLKQIDHDLHNASPLASIGQELNLIKAHRELAERGYHWLVVHAQDDEQARLIADCVRELGAERAQYYGHLVIEELIERVGDESQVSESPDRQLDAQTPSGEEGERAEMRQPDRA